MLLKKITGLSATAVMFLFPSHFSRRRELDVLRCFVWKKVQSFQKECLKNFQPEKQTVLSPRSFGNVVKIYLVKAPCVKKPFGMYEVCITADGGRLSAVRTDCAWVLLISIDFGCALLKSWGEPWRVSTRRPPARRVSSRRPPACLLKSSPVASDTACRFCCETD